MSRHSKSYLEKHQKLEDKENELRSLLDQESKEVQQKSATFLKTFGFVLVGLGIGYLFYRLFFRAEPNKKPEKPKKSKKSKQSKKVKRSGTQNVFVQRLSEQFTALVAKFLIDLLGSLLEKKDTNEGSKDS